MSGYVLEADPSSSGSVTVTEGVGSVTVTEGVGSVTVTEGVGSGSPSISCSLR